MADDWITLRHEETGGEQRIPADAPPEVLLVQESKGWARVPDDELAEREAAPFVPASTDTPAEADTWVDLVHPDLPAHQTQRVPNNAAALQGAFEAGWQFAPADPDEVAEVAQELRAEAGKRPGRPTKAELAEAEQIAAEHAAVTDEPPAIPGEQQPDQHAGDGDTSKE